MQKKYVVRLSGEERQSCEQVIDRLKGTSQKVRLANITQIAQQVTSGKANVRTSIAECRARRGQLKGRQSRPEGLISRTKNETAEINPIRRCAATPLAVAAVRLR